MLRTIIDGKDRLHRNFDGLEEGDAMARARREEEGAGRKPVPGVRNVLGEVPLQMELREASDALALLDTLQSGT